MGRPAHGRLAALGLLLPVAWLLGTVLMHAQSAKSDLTDPVQSERFIKITKSLICQCGCGMGLHDCNMISCESAIPLRKEIEMRIRNGESDEAILKVMVDRFGPIVLAAPTGKGFDLTAWITPFVVILVGLAVIYTWLRTFGKRKDAAANAAVPPVDVPDTVRERIEEELRRRQLE